MAAERSEPPGQCLWFGMAWQNPKNVIDSIMPKQKRSTAKSAKSGFVIGRAGFAKISAVEGIRLKPAMKKRATEAATQGLSAEEYRRMIVRSYRKS